MAVTERVYLRAIATLGSAAIFRLSEYISRLKMKSSDILYSRQECERDTAGCFVYPFIYLVIYFNII